MNLIYWNIILGLTDCVWSESQSSDRHSNVLADDMYSFRAFKHLFLSTIQTTHIQLGFTTTTTTTKSHRKTWTLLTFANVFAYFMTMINLKCIFK